MGAFPFGKRSFFESCLGCTASGERCLVQYGGRYRTLQGCRFPVLLLLRKASSCPKHSGPVSSLCRHDDSACGVGNSGRLRKLCIVRGNGRLDRCGKLDKFEQFRSGRCNQLRHEALAEDFHRLDGQVLLFGSEFRSFDRRRRCDDFQLCV